MLKALWRWIWPKDPEKTLKNQLELELHYVPRAEFDSAIQKLEQRIEWDLSEWYDKFSTLHARTAKREQRKAKANDGGQEQPSEREAPLSILHMRRKPWSV